MPASGRMVAELAAAAQILDQVVERGERFVLYKESRDGSFVKKSLGNLESSLQRTLKSYPNCVECAEKLAWVYYYETRYGMRNDFSELRSHAVSALKQHPNDGALLFLLANALLANQQISEAVVTFRRFLALSDTKPEWQEQARTALESAQHRFLTGWYKQADFYTAQHGSKLLAAAQAGVQRSNQAQQTLISGGTGVRPSGQPQPSPRPPGQDAFQWTPEKEMQLASQALSASQQKIQELQDPDLQKYLTDLVTKLVDKSPGPPFQYKIALLADEAVNAFAVPGTVMVNLGLLRFVENEAELVGVLSHELGHNSGHHMARMFMKQDTARSATAMLGRALANQSANTQMAASAASNIITNLVLLAYNRYEEREADIYATHIAFNAGYNPTYLNNVLLRMYKANPKQQAKFLSRHPPHPDRIDYLTDYLGAFPLGKEMRIDGAEFQQIKQKLGTLVPRRTGSANGPVLKP